MPMVNATLDANMAIEKNKPNTLKHDKKPFTTILNETILLIRDPAALGFYTLLASKPEGWEIVEQFLMNHFGVGRDFCRKKMKYLKQVGVLEVLAIRGERGRITGWETVLRVQITENPSSGEEPPALSSDQITENPTSGESTRLLKIQDVVAPESGGSAPINKRYIQIKEDLEIKETSTAEEEVEESVISQMHDQRLLLQRMTMNALPDLTNQEFLEVCKAHIDSRDTTKYNVAQSVHGICKLLAGGMFEPPASFTSKRQEAVKKKKVEEEARLRQAAQDKQHEEKMQRWAKEQQESKPRQEKSRPPRKLSDILKER